MQFVGKRMPEPKKKVEGEKPSNPPAKKKKKG